MKRKNDKIVIHTYLIASVIFLLFSIYFLCITILYNKFFVILFGVCVATSIATFMQKIIIDLSEYSKGTLKVHYNNMHIHLYVDFLTFTVKNNSLILTDGIGKIVLPKSTSCKFQKLGIAEKEL